MTEELTRAAQAASDATGLDVQVARSGIVKLWNLEIFDAIDGQDGEAPVLRPTCLTERAALAYLEGLEAGARIANVRHEPLVKLVREHIPQTAAEVLSELEG